ncbi:glycosyl hydrolase [Salmonella enterica subsp. enterica]|uniref:Glycosyl hydrolase n=1 Tax=Salmonella enterica I TaxID=59201 RepID=A0A379X363_SALET|nr:glycosyl hydrolase [Salmonella enterica subsp. enterica]
MKRSKELLLRWCDFSAFTPMMRTHEGNRPGDNWQFDGDAETIAHFARMTTVFTTLKPYLKQAVAQNAATGLPVMRPLFLHYETMPQLHPEISISARSGSAGRAGLRAGRCDWTLYLPEDHWGEYLDRRSSPRRDITVDAPIGKSPVFYRAKSEWRFTFCFFTEYLIRSPAGKPAGRWRRIMSQTSSNPATLRLPFKEKLAYGLGI